MFEFSIKSTKNVKSFSIVFDDGEVAQTIESDDIPEKINNRQFTQSKTLNTESVIAKRPDIPEVSTISIAEELQNLSF